MRLTRTPLRLWGQSKQRRGGDGTLCALIDALVDAHIMFKDMSADPYLLAAGIASDWPYGRGVYISEDKGFIIWVGEEDHLRIMCMEKGTVLNKVFDRLKAALDVVNGIEGLEFASSDDYGKVTSCPTNLGTGMRASVHIPIPNLTSDDRSSTSLPPRPRCSGSSPASW